MKLTVQDVAKITGLSIATVRQYSWRMKLGTKVGTKKFFTSVEAKKIGSGSRSAPRKKAGKTPARRKGAARKKR
jgi:hypothetical protein